jgi:hypothetical protein
MAENLTRREFMRDLGMFSAAATLAPRISFGEQESDKATQIERPSYVKEVDQITSGVDWTAMKRYNERETVRRGFVTYVGEDEVNRLSEKRAANLDQWLKEGKPGYTLRDMALSAGSGEGYAPLSFIGSQKARNARGPRCPEMDGHPGRSLNDGPRRFPSLRRRHRRLCRTGNRYHGETDLLHRPGRQTDDHR